MGNSLLDRDKLIIGEEYTNSEIGNFCKVGNMGGMRRSRKTNSLVIISDHTKMYEDRSEIDLQGREILHYTGMGKNGDQSLDFAQNKTLSNSNVNEVEVVLFERFSKNGGYIFRGPVQLAGIPYQEKQPGEDGLERNVWMFPLQFVYEDIVINEEDLRKLQEDKEERAEKIAKKLTLDALEKLAKRARGKSTRRTYSNSYTRDPFVAAFAKRRADGVCDLCNQPAQFNDKNGIPYLECHHINFLSRGGQDRIENVVALCVVCHKKQHIVEDVNEQEYLLMKYNQSRGSSLQ